MDKTQIFVRPMVPTMDIDPYAFLNRDLLTRGPIVSIQCHKDFDYANGVSIVWKSTATNLFLIEHDIFPSKEVLDELNDCSHPLCVPLYKTEPFHTGLSESIIPHKFKGEWLTEGMEWAETVGFGCVKIHKLVRKEIPSILITNISWIRLDSVLSRIISDKTGFFWHVHQNWVAHEQK